MVPSCCTCQMGMLTVGYIYLGYCLFLKNGTVTDGTLSVYKYCNLLNVGDVIEMELNMEGKKYAILSYFINNVDRGIAFHDIPSKEPYTLCVSFERCDKLQLIPTFTRHHQVE